MINFSIYKDEQLGTIYKLENEEMSAEIALDYGSNLISLKKGVVNLIHTNKEKLLEHGYTGCFVLYPFPNRIRDRKFTFEGTEYNLSEYPGRGADAPLIHGFAHDAVWSVDTEPESANNQNRDENTAQLVTSMEWNESQEFFRIFPLRSKLELRYELSSNGLRVNYTIFNTGNKNIPFGFALHPSFYRLSGDETTITIPAQKVMRMGADLLPTSELLDVETVMFRQYDLRMPIPVTAALRLDHVFTEMIPDASIRIDNPTTDISIQVNSSEDCKFTVLHTLGKDRTIEVEPETCSSDAVHAGEAWQSGLLVLAPGEQHDGFIEYKIL